MALSRVWLFGLLCLEAHQTYGKDFYCRDPDTGKLHDVNSTWPSTTFCGNYTCKLRKKGPNENVVPIRQFKVANISISDIIAKIPKTVPVVIDDDSKIGTQKNYDFGSIIQNSKQDDTLVEISTENDDRYLNENEIKTIARLLQGIKKSDLTAIVDIYNLAKDIHSFEEKDNDPPKSTGDKTANTINNYNDKTNKAKQNSYWYDPIQDQHKKNIDMVYQGSDHVPIVHQIREADPISYFKGTLTNKDFGKLPYYYPISSFQRDYSYSYPPYFAPQNTLYSTTQYTPHSAPQNPSYSVLQNQPCSVKSCTEHYQLYPSKSPIIHGISQGSNRLLMKPFTPETLKRQQPILLPYPYSYIQHYNSTGPAYYYDRNLWALVDMYGKYNSHYKPYYIANAYKSHLIKSPLGKDNIVEKKEKVEELIKSILLKTKEHITKTSSWRTPSISNDVLEDIRAHIEEKSTILKPFPLRKKVKVEKVGKVINLDELNKRSKRSALNEKEVAEKESEDNENLEAYIEKITCGTDPTPGYFRMGNLTEYYPGCCPQRINKSP